MSTTWTYEGGDGGELPESWAEFHARALAALSEVQSRAQGAHAARMR